jgi:hypothetical protein
VRPLVEGISFDSILESEANWLERAFEEEGSVSYG